MRLVDTAAKEVGYLSILFFFFFFLVSTLDLFICNLLWPKHNEELPYKDLNVLLMMLPSIIINSPFSFQSRGVLTIILVSWAHSSYTEALVTEKVLVRVFSFGYLGRHYIDFIPCIDQVTPIKIGSTIVLYSHFWRFNLKFLGDGWSASYIIPKLWRLSNYFCCPFCSRDI